MVATAVDEVDGVGVSDVIVVHDNSRFLTDSGIVVDGTYVVAKERHQSARARQGTGTNLTSNAANWNELQDSEMMIYEEQEADGEAVKEDAGGDENDDEEPADGSKMVTAPQQEHPV